MRLWSLHPQYLDPAGLVALWREALLARAVLRGQTRGYRHHPQLIRFREHPQPVSAIAAYLEDVYDEACRRGYAFDSSKLDRRRKARPMRVTNGQLAFEWRHLSRKLRSRNRAWAARWRGVTMPDAHPLLVVVDGPAEAWEATQSPRTTA